MTMPPARNEWPSSVMPLQPEHTRAAHLVGAPWLEPFGSYGGR